MTSMNPPTDHRNLDELTSNLKANEPAVSSPTLSAQNCHESLPETQEDSDTFVSSAEEEDDPYTAAERKQGRKNLAGMYAILSQVSFERFKERVIAENLPAVPPHIVSYVEFRRHICKDLLKDLEQARLVDRYDRLFPSHEGFFVLQMERFCDLSKTRAQQQRSCKDLIGYRDLQESMAGFPDRKPLKRRYEIYKPFMDLQQEPGTRFPERLDQDVPES